MIATFKVRAVIAVLLAGISNSAFAQNPTRDHAERSWNKGALPPIPDLTQDQKQKIADLKAATTQQAAPIRGQIVTLRNDIRALWTADVLDRGAITAKQADMAALVAKIKGVWTDFLFQLHDVLTPAQRTWLTQHGPGNFGHHGETILDEAVE